jgi:predicted nucleotidyltransferase
MLYVGGREHIQLAVNVRSDEMARLTTHHLTPSRDTILAEVAADAPELRKLGVTSLGLFGSYARGEQTADSDVDLLATFDHLTFRAFMDAKLLLEATLGLRVDLVLADDLRPRLRDRVLSEVIYAPGLSPLF